MEGRIKRLMIFSPPRHGKSELLSRRFPAAYLGRYPDRQFVSASYGAGFAADFGRDVRNIFSSQEFKALYPGVGLAADSSAKNKWHTNHNGIYISAGVDSALTGRGADILSIDDPVKDRAEAESELIRNSTWDWYRSTARTRLMPDAAIILTMTRWHPDDIAGRLMNNMNPDDRQPWDILNLTALDEHNNALWPEWYPEDVLAEIRKDIGPREWGALFMQDPRPDGSALFDVANCLVDREGIDTPHICDCVFATMDTAVKTGSKNDGTAVCFWAYTRHPVQKLVCLGWEVIQIEGSLLVNWIPSIFERLEEYSKNCRARRGTLGVYVEDKASGTILLQQCRRNPDFLNKQWYAHEIESKLTSLGKDERAINISGYIYKKMVTLTKDAYNKVMSYKGQTKNHLVTQVFDFRLGVPGQTDDALDAWCYGVAIALGNIEGF